MPEPQIFKATYSGVPVYEMMSKGVAVMRRRADSWLNATQILKVAGFDKPQRTRILEREVQKGEHEKVQGGYGKYQGTWIPLERGLTLAKQYNCEGTLRPIIDFKPASKSPPPAPKHLVASAGSKPAKRGLMAEGSSASLPTRSSRRRAATEVSEEETVSVDGSDDGSMTPSPSEASSSSRTPSPIQDLEKRGEKRKINIVDGVDGFSDDESANVNGITDSRTYGDQILEYFISDTNQIPQILISPPADFDPNMAIDDDGHTALHWGCAMGRIRTVKLLLSAGADIYKVNKIGQTPLMRSVMFANNYDVRKFPELYELLHRTTLNIDNYNRTVFHHVVDVAMSKGKTHAARYYMDHILSRLSEYPTELADVINFQDEDLETALTMAARCRSKRLVKLLIDHGADPKIVNSDGKSAEDYILEDERFRSSPVPGPRPTSLANPPSQPTVNSVTEPKLPLHHSLAGQKAGSICVHDMATMLESLAASFDQELRDKERDTSQAHALLNNIQAEILESQRAVGHLKMQAESLPLVKQKHQDINTELTSKMSRRVRRGYEKWIAYEERREQTIRGAAQGQLMLAPTTVMFQVDDNSPDAVNGDATSDQQKQSTTYREDISDLQALHSALPSDPDGIRAECDALRNELFDFRDRRKANFEELVTCQGEAGTSGKMTAYRRLISVGAGGIPPEEVDQNLNMLLESLEFEEPSSSSAAWSGPRHSVN